VLFAPYFAIFGLAHAAVFWFLAVWRNAALLLRSTRTTGGAASSTPEQIAASGHPLQTALGRSGQPCGLDDAKRGPGAKDCLHSEAGRAQECPIFVFCSLLASQPDQHAKVAARD